MVTIESMRLGLREFTKEDFEAVHRYASNPNVVRFMAWGPNTETETNRFIQRKLQEQIVQPRLSYDLAITLDGELIGGGGLSIRDRESGEAELGYCLDEPHWGKGLGTEFAVVMIKYGFRELSLHRVFAKCDSKNHASYHVMEKCGMKKEGHLRENQKIRGVYRDTLIYSILRHEWCPIQS